jgi:hypothetical protein
MNEINKINENKEKLEEITRAIYERAEYMQCFYDVKIAIKEMIVENQITQIDCPEFLKFLKMAFTAGFVNCFIKTDNFNIDETEVKL